MMLPNFSFLLCLLLRGISSHGDFIDKQHRSLDSLGKLSSLNIDTSLNDLRQDDPRLIRFIREKYLIPPSSLPYNFSNPSLPKLHGQFGQAQYIAKTFFG